MKIDRELTIRCPRLGHEVPFSYCEQEAGDLPCRQAVLCWEARLPVEDHLRRKLGAEGWERFCGQAPQDRLTTLLDLAAAAQRRRGEKG